MTRPKLALCNFIPDVHALKEFALAHGFAGVDWTFKLADLPESPLEETRLLKNVSRLQPLEVRYHCAFNGLDLGDADPEKARAAREAFKKACRIVSKLNGKFMTIHMGLGRDSMEDLLWDETLSALSELVHYARILGIRLCLENLAGGWSSRPELFEKLVRKSGAGVTLDIGHARVCHSVESQHYAVEDFIFPHAEQIHNAHIYHEERNETHLPPSCLEDILDRLDLLHTLPCDWWVLELRNREALWATRRVVQEYFDARSAIPSMEYHV